MVVCLAALLLLGTACGQHGPSDATATTNARANQTIEAGFLTDSQATSTRAAQLAATLPPATSTAVAALVATALGPGAPTAGTARAGTPPPRPTPTGLADSLPDASVTTPRPRTPTATRTPVPTAVPTRAAASPDRVSATVFHDPQGHFSFVVPQGWRIVVGQSTGVLVEVDATAPPGSVNIASETLHSAMTLDEYVMATMANIQRAHPDYQFGAGGSEPTTLGGRPARRYALVGIAGGEGIRITQYLSISGETGYAVTLASGEADSAAFGEQAKVLLDSFAFGPAS